MCSKSPDPPICDSGHVLEIGARLEHRPSEMLIRAAFQKELADQNALFQAMGLVDIAHTLVTMEAETIPVATGRKLLRALLELHGRPRDFMPDPAKGDLYTNREAWISEHSAATDSLGAGRARREATTSAFLIELRKRLLSLTEAVVDAGSAIVARAREFRCALMPDYTYLQSAQPTTFGHYLLTFAFPIGRDVERLRALYGRVNRSPAGCGSTNGSRLPQDRELLARLLGFDGLVTHARDAMWQADLPIEAAAVVTAVLVNLDRLAEDLQIFATEEFGLLELDDRHARASKIMPQKKNPYALTHIRATASSHIGTLAASAALGRTPSGQPDNRLPIYGLIPCAVEETRDAALLMAEIVRLLRFNEQHARRRLDRSFAVATDLAEMLVLEAGLEFRDAYRLVAHLVRDHLAEGDLNHVTSTELARTARRVVKREIALSESRIRHALDPETAVSVRNGTGGAASMSVEAMADECDRGFSTARFWVDDCRRRLEQAEDALLQRAVECIEASGP